MPGIAEGFPSSMLPLWGNYCLVDFTLASLLPAGARGRGMRARILVDGSWRTLAEDLAARWRKPPADIIRTDGAVEGFLALLEADGAEHVILSSLSYAAMLEPEGVAALLAACGNGISKASIQRTPLDLFGVRRDRLLEHLRAAAARPSRKPAFREWLFDDILLPGIEALQEVPGTLLFRHSVAELAAANQWILGRTAEVGYNAFVARLPEPVGLDDETRISDRGSVKDSFLASGVEVEGAVEGSVLFPHVVVRRNARVVNSVVMNHNRIGAGAVVQNALLFPAPADSPRGVSNIGDNAVVGALGSAARNADFPEHTPGGLAVIGMGAEIPGGFKAEAAVVIGAGVTAAALRRRKLARRGTSILKDG